MLQSLVIKLTEFTHNKTQHICIKSAYFYASLSNKVFFQLSKYSMKHVTESQEYMYINS